MQNRLRRLAGERLRRPLSALLLASVAAFALPGPALAAGTSTGTGTGFTIRVHIANHTPIVGKRWPIELIVTKGHKKLSGTVRYQWVFAGAVIRTQPQHGAYRFTHGVYQDQLVFPAQAVGQPLTLRFQVRTRYGTEHADWALRTQKSR
jgi:hypothetical protein